MPILFNKAAGTYCGPFDNILYSSKMSKELATTCIVANAVSPAVIQTEMRADVTQEQIAVLAGWMWSKECAFSTGAVFDFSGGRATY